MVYSWLLLLLVMAGEERGRQLNNYWQWLWLLWLCPFPSRTYDTRNKIALNDAMPCTGRRWRTDGETFVLMSPLSLPPCPWACAPTLPLFADYMAIMDRWMAGWFHATLRMMRMMMVHSVCLSVSALRVNAMTFWLWCTTLSAHPHALEARI